MLMVVLGAGRTGYEPSSRIIFVDFGTSITTARQLIGKNSNKLNRVGST